MNKISTATKVTLCIAWLVHAVIMFNFIYLSINIKVKSLSPKRWHKRQELRHTFLEGTNKKKKRKEEECANWTTWDISHWPLDFIVHLSKQKSFCIHSCPQSMYPWWLRKKKMEIHVLFSAPFLLFLAPIHPIPRSPRHSFLGQIFFLNWIRRIFFNLIYKNNMCLRMRCKWIFNKFISTLFSLLKNMYVSHVKGHISLL